MAGLGAMVLGVVLIIVLYGIVPMIGYQIDTAVTIPNDPAATGTITFGTGPGVADEFVNVSAETYTLVAAYSAPFDVVVGDGAAATLSAALTAEINTNSTLVSAVDGTGSVVITSLVLGTAGNAYGSTTNVTDASFGAATLTGGAASGSNWNSDKNTDLPTGPDFWITLSGFITLSALMLFVGGFIGVLKGLKG
jgi:hypothetical protein